MDRKRGKKCTKGSNAREKFFEKFNKIVEEGNRRSKLSATQMEAVR